MDTGRVVRTMEALLLLAFDQRGKPEGDNALRRANEWAQRHSVSGFQLTRRANECADALGVTFAQRVRTSEASDFTQWWDTQRSYGSSFSGQSAQHTRSWRVHYESTRPFTDLGTCPECGRDFVRGKWHQGNRARYCSPTCHTVKRNRDAADRMRRNRAAKRA
jgi:hypothetical protein